MLRRLYDRLPAPIKPVVRRPYRALKPIVTFTYRRLHPGKQTPSVIEHEFVDRFFDDRAEYEAYIDEARTGRAQELRTNALDRYSSITGRSAAGGVDSTTGARVYALIRKYQPDVVVETGVCNGLSTLYLLLALNENDAGTLYSIDYPYYADEPLEEFRADTFAGYGGAAIPSDKSPGWIIPDELRDDWVLREGKSQAELPQLRSEIDEIDLFIHDSEHSYSCMLFEFELAWAWLSDGGILLADDIDWNSAFAQFTAERTSDSGLIADGVGFAVQHHD